MDVIFPGAHPADSGTNDEAFRGGNHARDRILVIRTLIAKESGAVRADATLACPTAELTMPGRVYTLPGPSRDTTP